LVGVLQALDLRGVALAEGGVLELVAQLHLESAVLYPFVGQAALAVGRFAGRVKGWHPAAERFGQPAVEMHLGDRFVIDGVVDLAGASVFERGDDDVHEVVAVDHVDQAFAVPRDLRFTFEELSEQVAAIGAVDAGDSQDYGWELALLGGGTAPALNSRWAILLMRMPPGKVTTPGVVAFTVIILGPSPCMRKGTCFRLRMISVASINITLSSTSPHLNDLIRKLHIA